MKYYIIPEVAMTRVMESLRMTAGLFDLDAIPPGPGLVKAAMVRAALTMIESNSHVINHVGMGEATSGEGMMLSVWGELETP